MMADCQPSANVPVEVFLPPASDLLSCQYCPPHATPWQADALVCSSLPAAQI